MKSENSSSRRDNVKSPVAAHVEIKSFLTVILTLVLHILIIPHETIMVLSVGVQELCLNIIPTFANLIDYPSMKNSLVPRIKSACLQTSSLAVSCPSHPL